MWFRDASPFDALRYKLLPELIDAKSSTPNPRKLRMWSAACSTGQEAYSMAMAFADIVPDVARWDLEVLGSDVSREALDHAKQGVYGDLEVSRGLEQQHLGGRCRQDERGRNERKVREASDRAQAPRGLAS